MIPMPQTIETIVLSWRGVCLSRTTTGFYVVGLDYTPGSTIVSWDPTTEFFGSRDINEARAKYLHFTKDPKGTVPS